MITVLAHIKRAALSKNERRGKNALPGLQLTPGTLFKGAARFCARSTVNVQTERETGYALADPSTLVRAKVRTKRAPSDSPHQDRVPHQGMETQDHPVSRHQNSSIAIKPRLTSSPLY
jgi:hypothetical protein